MNANREFAELVGSIQYPSLMGGVMWQCPDYTADPRLVLREMMKRSDFGSFIKWVCGDHCSQGVRIAELVTDTTGLLRDKAIEWMKGRER